MKLGLNSDGVAAENSLQKKLTLEWDLCNCMYMQAYKRIEIGKRSEWFFFVFRLE